MTDNEIKKALEHEIELAKDVGDNIAYIVEMSVLTNALDLIDRLTDQLNSAINGQETLQGYVAEKDKEINCLQQNLKEAHIDIKERLAEIERLKENLRVLTFENLQFIKTNAKIKAEAYKECIEKIKEYSNKMELVCSGALVRTDYTITKDKFDNLLKELVGDSNGNK